MNPSRMNRAAGTSRSMLLIRLRKAAGRLARRLPVQYRLIDARRLATRRRLLEAMPPESCCAEIGVWRGTFSSLILEVVRPRELDLIDPWKFIAGAGDTRAGGRAAVDQTAMDAVYEDVVRRFAKRPEVVIHREMSVDAAPRFEPEYFDWVYIDGDHRYPYVRADLEAYLPLVRRGGFLTGDDYYHRPDQGLPVKTAVDELVASGRARLVSVSGSQFILERPFGEF